MTTVNKTLSVRKAEEMLGRLNNFNEINKGEDWAESEVFAARGFLVGEDFFANIQSVTARSLKALTDNLKKALSKAYVEMSRDMAACDTEKASNPKLDCEARSQREIKFDIQESGGQVSFKAEVSKPGATPAKNDWAARMAARKEALLKAKK